MTPKEIARKLRERSRHLFGRTVSGVVLWTGSSLLDGSPLVAVAILRAQSDKQKGAVQVYILREDIHPGEAVSISEDFGNCGDCPLRVKLCYVAAGREVANIWATYQDGGYPYLPPSLNADLFEGLPVRLAAYGDPLAVPEYAWEPVRETAGLVLAYTHQWHRDSQAPSTWAMASTQSVTGSLLARARGWRTYRVRGLGERYLDNEIECLDKSEHMRCITCTLCSGESRPSSPSISIEVHGMRKGAWPPPEVEVERLLAQAASAPLADARKLRGQARFLVKANRLEWLFEAGDLPEGWLDVVANYYAVSEGDELAA